MNPLNAIEEMLLHTVQYSKGNKEKTRSEGKYLHIKAATYLVG